MSAKKTAPAKKAAAREASGKVKPDPTAGIRGTNSENQENEAVHRKPEASSNDSADKPGDITGDAGGSVTEAQNNQSTKPIPYGRHRRTVELATRLACAQITAEAYSRSTKLTVSGIQRVAAAFVMASARIKMELETLRSNPDLIDAAFVDRAYADLLSAAEVNELPLDQATPLNYHDHDDLFEGAMFRAQRLLRPSTEDTTVIHAEQMFDAEEILSENKVGIRFEKCVWPELETHTKFHAFIVRVERWLHGHLGRLHFPEEDEQYEKEAEMMAKVLELGRRRQENDLFRKIYDLVRSHEPPNRPRGAWTSIEEFSNAMWTRCLINVICCGRRPSRAREDETRTIRYYRPWGLFRFLRIHGAKDPVGNQLLELLVCERKDLKLDAVIHPFRQNYPLTYDFGPLDKLVEDREEETMRHEGVQGAVNLEPVATLLDKVQVIEMSPDLIDRKFQTEVLEQARSGNPFEPKWPDTIKTGFRDLLLAGHDRPMEHIGDFLAKFYLPLLDAYGAFGRVRKWSDAQRDLREVVDLFPDGWDLSFAETDQSAQPGPASAAKNRKTRKSKTPKSPQIQKAIKVTLCNRVGEKIDVFFNMDTGHATLPTTG